MAATGLCAAMAATSAAAQPALDPAAPFGATDWTGGYAGLSFGVIASGGEAVRGDFIGPILTRDVRNGLFPGSIEDTETSLLGGLAIGYNLQRDAFVGGIELDLSGLDQDVDLRFSRIDPSDVPPFAGVDTVTGYATELGALATLRLRAGYATGRNLLYATAGLASGDVRNEFTLEIPALGYASPDWSEDERRYGYVLGLGVERRIGARLSLKAEAMYYDLEDARVVATDPATFPGERIDYEFQNDGAIARLGLNVAF